MTLVRASAIRSQLTRAAIRAQLPRASGLGPELAGALASWTPGGTGVTVDAGGIHFVAANNSTSFADWVVTAPGETANDAAYEVAFTVANRTGGSVRALVYGASTNKLGSTPSVSANGDYVFRVTTNATGSLTDRIRIQATGTSGQNTFDVTKVSLRRVL